MVGQTDERTPNRYIEPSPHIIRAVPKAEFFNRQCSSVREYVFYVSQISKNVTFTFFWVVALFLWVTAVQSLSCYVHFCLFLLQFQIFLSLKTQQGHARARKRTVSSTININILSINIELQRHIWPNSLTLMYHTLIAQLIPAATPFLLIYCSSMLKA